jgi:hypothetical protein
LAPEFVQVAVPVFRTFTVMVDTWPGRACARSREEVWDTNEYSQVASVVADTALLRADSPELL